jgi:hypothetical protein
MPRKAHTKIIVSKSNFNLVFCPKRHQGHKAIVSISQSQLYSVLEDGSGVAPQRIGQNYRPFISDGVTSEAKLDEGLHRLHVVNQPNERLPTISAARVEIQFLVLLSI